MRCMLYIERAFPTEQYEAAFRSLWTCYWGEHMDISKPDVLAACLRRTFTDDEVKTILAQGTSPEFKKLLTEQTARVVAKGAFGAPWSLVTDGDGKEEPFFGSDR